MKRGKIYVFITAIILFIFTGLCNAEPDSTIKYLMNVPVSMLDLGLYKLSVWLEAESEGNIYPVSYNWETNRIEIRHSTLGIYHEYKDVAEYECKKEIKFIRLHLSYGLFEKSFRHSGYRLKGEPKDLEEKLMRISEITVTTAYKVGKKRKKIICKGSFQYTKIGSDIYFSEEDFK